MGKKKTLLWIIYIIETRYRSLTTIHRTGVAVLHCPGCVQTSNLRCLDRFTSIRIWLLPISGVAKNLSSSSQLSPFAGGDACNWRCFTVNWTTLHTTRLADMAPATPSHGPGLQFSPVTRKMFPFDDVIMTRLQHAALHLMLGLHLPT